MTIPDWIEEIFFKYLTTELTYIDKTRPMTDAVVCFYDKEKGSLVFSTSPAFYHKVKGIQHNPKVCLLFSNALHSGLSENSVILVQGDAHIDEEDVANNMNNLLDLLKDQPDCWKKEMWMGAMKQLNSWLVRKLMDWYILRINIKVKPQKIFGWRNGNLNETPEIIEVK